MKEKERGFALVILLIVFVIIFYLTWQYFKPQQNLQNQVSTYQFSMNKSKSAACLSDIKVYETKLQQWLINNSNQVPTLKDIGIPEKCPEEGTYSISEDGQTVYCSLHKPNTNQQEEELVSY